MSPSDPSPEHQSSLRAAHRARHTAAAPEAPFDIDDDAEWDSDNGMFEDAVGTARHRDDVPSAGGWPRLGRTLDVDPEPDAVPTGSDLAPDANPTFDVGPAPVPAMVPARTTTPDDLPDRATTGEAAPAPRRSRAGRNLPAAIGVSIVLGGSVLAALLLWKPAFYAIVAVAVVIGIWEMVRAVRTTGPKPPMQPLLLGGLTIPALALYGGADALPYGLLGTVLAVLVWRLADGPAHYQRDVIPALLIAVYVPFLASFAVLLAAPGDGHLRVLATLLGVVLSDTGGYAVGVFLGRHSMAPSVSPGKSWEGFGGSVAASALGSAVVLVLLLDGRWWHGLVFGVAVAAAATLGDLAESLLKRDLKIKDMSSLLPGHGGLMDRLDSILLAAPVGYAVLTFLLPPG